LAAGRLDRAEELARVMEAFAGEGLLIPEQVWDAEDIPDRELFLGDGSGSARPLVWAHAEYLKLRRSIADGRCFDQPPQTVQRYIVEGRSGTPYAIWRFNGKIRTLQAGKILRVETLARATIHWAVDDWSGARDADAVDTGLGVFVADLDTAGRTPGSQVLFTFFWSDAARWEGADFRVTVR
jgi:glucoamylase